MPLRLSIVTPTRPLVDAEVETVTAPGAEGEFGVLPAHAPHLMPLDPGVVRYVAAGNELRLAISGGFAEVTGERVTLLARSALLPSEIDAALVEEERAQAETALARLAPGAPAQERDGLAAAVAHAEAKLQTLED